MTDRPLRRVLPGTSPGSSHTLKPNNHTFLNSRFQIPDHMRCLSDTERGPNSVPRDGHLSSLSRVLAVANRLVNLSLKSNMYSNNCNSTSDCALSPKDAGAIVDDLFSSDVLRLAGSLVGTRLLDASRIRLSHGDVIRRSPNTIARDRFVKYLSSRSALEVECNIFMCLSPYSFRLKTLYQIRTPKQLRA